MSYTSHADLGGQPGHGAVTPEAEGELFHAAWEPAALAIVLAMGATGSWNIDMSRSARETLPDYARLSYYRIWLAALEKLMLERGQVFDDELAAGRMLHPPAPVARVLQAGQVAPALAKGSPTLRADGPAALFQPGQRVRTRAGAVAHHTRLPGYVRGKRGTIERLHGNHVFADTHAQGLGERPEPLYTVVFDGAELWGADAAPGLRVSVDAWQSYLEAA
ncbi:MAG: nitrile hydratase subunit beta [Ramlibacter sp.]